MGRLLFILAGLWLIVLGGSMLVGLAWPRDHVLKPLRTRYHTAREVQPFGGVCFIAGVALVVWAVFGNV